MPRTRLLVFSACWLLSFSVSLPAQTGTYFQALVKEAKTRIREIGADRLAAFQAAEPSAVLVDVREDNEWEKGRIPKAIHVGRGVLEVNIEARVPQKSTPIVVYCQGGGRSAVAADVLTKMGYTNVSSLAGGLAAYRAAGRPAGSAKIGGAFERTVGACRYATPAPGVGPARKACAAGTGLQKRSRAFSRG